MLNHTILMGRVTAEPTIRYTASNLPVTSFSLAVQRNYKSGNSNEKETDFFDIVAWRNTAEFVSKYITKGTQIVVSGSLQTRSWKDKEGNNRKAVEIVADEVYFADSKRDTTRSEASPLQKPEESLKDDADAFLAADDGELPF